MNGNGWTPEAIRGAGHREEEFGMRRHEADVHGMTCDRCAVHVREIDAVDDGVSGDFDVDLLVVGSGGGAFARAIRARDLGRSVLMVERGTIGGTCVNVGCIPSKALLVDGLAAHGDPERMRSAQRRKRALVERLRADKYEHLLDEYGIGLCRGHAELLDPHTVSIAGETVRARAILLAVGGRPSVPAIAGLEETGYLTSTSALELERPPARLAVLGTGSVGLELGQMLGDFGARVTFIARHRRVRGAEPEAAEVIGELLTEAGHVVLEHHTTQAVTLEGDAKVLRGVDGEGNAFELRVDDILLATGRTPNTDGLGLERVGVGTDDAGLATSSSTPGSAPTPPASSPRAIAPSSPNTSMSPPRAAPPPPRTRSARAAAGSTSAHCRGSSSPSPTSPQPGSPRPRRARRGSRSRPACSRWRPCRGRSSTATRAVSPSSSPTPGPVGCSGRRSSPPTRATSSSPPRSPSSAA